MPEKVIPLDDPGRKLIIRQPEIRKTPSGDVFFWVFLLDETEYRGEKGEPFEFFAVATGHTPEQVARAPKGNLYSYVSSSWLDESWARDIEPQIIAFIKEGA